MTVLLRLLVAAAALWTATRVVDGIRYHGDLVGLLGVAVVFAVVNGIVKPVVKFFSFPFVLLTLGFFLLVINALMLLLTARLATTLGLAFEVRGFGPAFRGALVVSLSTLVLTTLFVDEDKKKKKRRD